MQKKNPQVTIGMPVLNGGDGLAQALDSLLGQTFQEFEIIISDNNSEDSTQEICQRYIDKDSRIKYFRQCKTLSASANFGFSLFKAESPFFMWAADDDYWAPSFIEKNYINLLNNKLAVASQSKVLFVRDGIYSNYSGGTYQLISSTAQNLANFFRNPSDNSRFYGVYRTEVLQKIFPKQHFHAFDWAVSAATINLGHHLEVDETLMIREQTPNANYEKAVLRDHKFIVFRTFPILFMTYYLFINNFIKFNKEITYLIIRLNIYMHCLFGVYRFRKFSEKVVSGEAKWIKVLDSFFLNK
ncbi:glycosyltransferase family 2 protein [Polynucleobacter paneuropaeus]|nr:glycosyltransferase family 2 protein [Polynucleobacter paneuropaeus]